MAIQKYVHWRDKDPQDRSRTNRSRRSCTDTDLEVEKVSKTKKAKQPEDDKHFGLTEVKPAAFPSLEPGTKEPRRDGRHGLGRLMQERTSGNPKLARDSIKRIDDMYNHLRFQENMGKAEKKWYAELRERYKFSDDDGVSTKRVNIQELWPSLRQTIIEELRNELAGVYHRDYYPVEQLLNITTKTIEDVLLQDSQDENISRYALKLKMAFPTRPVNPETPPPHAVISAIKFLKQEHLPASLLGEWQFPLPKPEQLAPQFPPPLESEAFYSSSYPYDPNFAHRKPAPLVPLDVSLENLAQGFVHKPVDNDVTDDLIDAFGKNVARKWNRRDVNMGFSQQAKSVQARQKRR